MPSEEDWQDEEDIDSQTQDIAGDSLKKTLNDFGSYDDGSVISSINIESEKVIVLTNPADRSTITIHFDKKRTINDHDLKKLVNYRYDARVLRWFGSSESLAKETKEGIDRHRFAKRVDEIAQIYGHKARFQTWDGQIIKNMVLPGTITTQDGRELNGTFEYAFNEDTGVLYHRFFHPHSRTIARA